MYHMLYLMIMDVKFFNHFKERMPYLLVGTWM